jgi:hypothetical protein
MLGKIAPLSHLTRSLWFFMSAPSAVAVKYGQKKTYTQFTVEFWDLGASEKAQEGKGRTRSVL